MRDAQGNITIHNPTDLGQSGGSVAHSMLDSADLTQGLDPHQTDTQQQTIPQDAIVSDVQLQSALQQQVGS